MTEITGLVLRKTVYAETSLVIAALTAERGQLHFLLKGALQSGRRKFPAVDLFRVVHLSCSAHSRAELHAAYRAECLRDFTAIAQHPDQYRAALWLCRLVLQNTVAEAPVPQLFPALVAACARLSRGEAVTPSVLAVGLVLLAEQGLLPHLTPNQPEAAGMDQMLAYAADETLAAPPYDPTAWRDLARWLYRFLHQVSLNVPEGWQQMLPGAAGGGRPLDRD